MPDMGYRVSMTNNPTEQQKTIPQAWYDFMQETIRLDKGTNVAETKPRGWHWFWGLYCLRMEIRKDPLSVEIDKFPPFDFETIQKTLPDKHWLKNETIDDTREIYTTLSVTKSFKNLCTVLKNKDHEKIEKIDFSKYTFTEDVDFSNFIFPINTDFRNANFVQDIFFNNAIFCETADFEKAIFQDKKSHCKETAKFRNTIFAKIANFRNATFWGYANFKGSKLKGRAFFQEAKFKWHAPRFYDAKFNNEITWAGIKLPRFKKAPVDKHEKVDGEFIPISDRKIFISISDRKTIKKNRRRRIEENQNSYENTAILLEERKKHHDQHLFFREEMQCRRHLEKNIFICLAFGLYGGLAGYGYGIGRAFTAWFLHIFFGTIAIFIIAYCGGLEIGQALFCSISTSFANANPFVFFGFKEGALMECYECLHDLSPLGFGTIRGVQTVIGIPILFLLLTTLRIRFRLK